MNTNQTRVELEISPRKANTYYVRIKAYEYFGDEEYGFSAVGKTTPEKFEFLKRYNAEEKFLRGAIALYGWNFDAQMRRINTLCKLYGGRTITRTYTSEGDITENVR